MNTTDEKVVAGREKFTAKKIYEKPGVTTFGSVSDLTMGSGGSVSDGFFGGKHHHHTKNRG